MYIITIKSIFMTVSMVTFEGAQHTIMNDQFYLDVLIIVFFYNYNNQYTDHNRRETKMDQR